MATSQTNRNVAEAFSPQARGLDAIAIQAMQGLIAGNCISLIASTPESRKAELVKQAYDIAEAMLRESDRRANQPPSQL